MSEQSKETKDALFQQEVRNYIVQDTRDKAEIKKDLKQVQLDINTSKINVAVLQTKSGIIGAIAGALLAGIIEWLASVFHK